MIIRNEVIEIVTQSRGPGDSTTDQRRRDAEFNINRHKYRLMDSVEEVEALQPIISNAINSRRQFMSITNRQNFSKVPSKSLMNTQSKF
jgi:hypothetical protein